MRILIVDDSEPMRRYIRRIADLSHLAVEAYFEAETGLEALDILRSEAIDVVLTDINMPEMAGDDLVRSMMCEPELRNIPVVVVSTDRTRDRVREMVSLGAVGYVEKPFSPERLGSELQRVVEVAAEIERL